MKQRTNYQFRSDLNVESSEMKMWEDPLVITAAQVGAIELYDHAVNGTKLEDRRATKLYTAILRLLVSCFLQSIEASGKKENESEVK